MTAFVDELNHYAATDNFTTGVRIKKYFFDSILNCIYVTMVMLINIELILVIMLHFVIVFTFI